MRTGNHKGKKRLNMEQMTARLEVLENRTRTMLVVSIGCAVASIVSVVMIVLQTA